MSSSHADPTANSSRSEARLRVHLRLIDDGVTPVVAAYHQHMQCERGCSSCCSQVFAVSEVEAAFLERGLATLSDPERKAIVARAVLHKAGDPCPVLDDHGACQLYEHRPRICRKYGIPLWNPEQPERVHTCPLNFRDVADLDPELIVEPQAAWAADWIRLREELGLPKVETRSIAVWLRSSAEGSDTT